MAAKLATMFGDVTAFQQRHHTWNIPHLVEKIKGSTEGKIVLKYCNISKTQNHGGGVTLRVRPRVKSTLREFGFYQ